MLRVAALSMAIGEQPFSCMALNQAKCPVSRSTRLSSPGHAQLLAAGENLPGGMIEPSLASNSGAPEPMRLRAFLSDACHVVRSAADTFARSQSNRCWVKGNATAPVRRCAIRSNVDCGMGTGPVTLAC